MELFDTHGHLTDNTLRAFSGGEALTELERLEIAEHLDFCDECLMRSIDLLPETALLTPPHSCQTSLRTAIRLRATRLFASRYATAAAALVIVAAMWSFNVFGGMVASSAQLSESQFGTSQRLSQIAQSVNNGLRQFTDLFDFSGVPDAPRANLQGGTNP